MLAGTQVVARYEHAPHDPGNHASTCKVWHQVYAPDGRLLTKGLGGSYEHHRGLFFGANQLRHGNRTWDFWHCRNGETQQHLAFAEPQEPGLPDGCQVAVIRWLDGGRQELLREHRVTRATALDPDTVALDVWITLQAVAGPVTFDGDPQHSGHQFRALQQFAEPEATPVRFVRPAGARGGKDDVWTDCAWIAMVLPLQGGPVTVLRVEEQGNPRPVRWSTRGYGRFGATFTKEITPDAPLRLHYRYVIAIGELDAQRCAALAGSAGS